MGRMDPERVQAIRVLIDNVSQQALLLSIQDAADVLREVEFDEAVGLFSDPTWWMHNIDNVRLRKGIFQAFYDFRSSLEKLKAGVERTKSMEVE